MMHELHYMSYPEGWSSVQHTKKSPCVCCSDSAVTAYWPRNRNAIATQSSRNRHATAKPRDAALARRARCAFYLEVMCWAPRKNANQIQQQQDFSVGQTTPRIVCPRLGQHPQNLGARWDACTQTSILTIRQGSVATMHHGLRCAGRARIKKIVWS